MRRACGRGAELTAALAANDRRVRRGRVREELVPVLQARARRAERAQPQGKEGQDHRVRARPRAGVPLTRRSIDIEAQGEVDEIQDYLKEKTGQRSVPNIFISASSAAALILS